MSGDFLLRLTEDEYTALVQRADGAHLSVDAYLRRQCGIDADTQTRTFAAAARSAGRRFDVAFAELDEQLARRPRTCAIGLAAGAG